MANITVLEGLKRSMQATRNYVDNKAGSGGGSGSNVTEQTVAGWGFTKNTGDYSKPETGIPESDLSSDLISKLNGIPSGGSGSASAPYVTPEQFGAKADGSTYDDAAIASAITYAKDNGNKIVLDGKYHIRTGITGIPDYMEISGHGTIYSDQDCFNLDNVAHLLICGLKLRPHRHGIVVTTTDGWSNYNVFKDMHIYNDYASVGDGSCGIKLEVTGTQYENYLTETYFYNVVCWGFDYGFRLNNPTESVELSSIKFSGCSSELSKTYGQYLTNASDISFIECRHVETKSLTFKTEGKCYRLMIVGTVINNSPTDQQMSSETSGIIIGRLRTGGLYNKSVGIVAHIVDGKIIPEDNGLTDYTLNTSAVSEGRIIPSSNDDYIYRFFNHDASSNVTLNLSPGFYGGTGKVNEFWVKLTSSTQLVVTVGDYSTTLTNTTGGSVYLKFEYSYISWVGRWNVTQMGSGWTPNSGSSGSSSGESGSGNTSDLPYVTPEQFGAKGDGSADDTTAFELAIANGKTVVVDGTKKYKITRTLYPIKSQVIIGTCNTNKTQWQLQESGRETGYIHYTGNGILFDCSAGNVEIKNIQIVGDRLTGSIGIGNMRYDGKIINCGFYNLDFAIRCIMMSGLIDGCSIDECNIGIMSINDTKMSNTHIQGCKTGMRITSGYGSTHCVNCKFDWCIDDGVSLEDDHRFVMFTNCYFDHNKGYGINAHNGHDDVISNCIFYRNMYETQGDNAGDNYQASFHMIDGLGLSNITCALGPGSDDTDKTTQYPSRSIWIGDCTNVAINNVIARGVKTPDIEFDGVNTFVKQYGYSDSGSATPSGVKTYSTTQDAWNYNGLSYGWAAADDYRIEAGKTYAITFDGKKYIRKAKSGINSYGDFVTYLGNLGIEFSDGTNETGEPFLYQVANDYIYLYGTVGSHTLAFEEIDIE